MELEYRWRAALADEELEAVHAAAFERAPSAYVWNAQLVHSLGWVSARTGDGRLVGFVNVAWDGGIHAFILDTVVRPDLQRHGIGRELVRRAVEQAREAGCEWVHVDFELELESFYFDACGFEGTSAGLIRL